MNGTFCKNKSKEFELLRQDMGEEGRAELAGSMAERPLRKIFLFNE